MLTPELALSFGFLMIVVTGIGFCIRLVIANIFSGPRRLSGQTSRQKSQPTSESVLDRWLAYFFSPDWNKKVVVWRTPLGISAYILSLVLALITAESKYDKNLGLAFLIAPIYAWLAHQLVGYYLRTRVFYLVSFANICIFIATIRETAVIGPNHICVWCDIVQLTGYHAGWLEWACWILGMVGWFQIPRTDVS